MWYRALGANILMKRCLPCIYQPPTIKLRFASCFRTFFNTFVDKKASWLRTFFILSWIRNYCKHCGRSINFSMHYEITKAWGSKIKILSHTNSLLNQPTTYILTSQPQTVRLRRNKTLRRLLILLFMSRWYIVDTNFVLKHTQSHCTSNTNTLTKTNVY